MNKLNINFSEKRLSMENKEMLPEISPCEIKVLILSILILT